MWYYKNREFLCYLLIWSSCVLFAIISFTRQSSKYFSLYKDDYNDFETGYFIRKQKDIADLEWQTMIFLLQKIWIWICALLILSEFLRKKKLFEVLKLSQIWTSLIFVLTHFGPITLVGIIIQPFLFKIIRYITIRKSALWICNIILIFLISFYKYKISSETFRIYYGYNEKEIYLHILAIYWTNLRSFSFFMEQDKNSYRVSNLDMYSYCFYLPVLFNGPFLFYTDFKNAHLETLSIKYRLFNLANNILRYLFWLIVIELSLHFIYVNATSFQVKLVESFDGWALYGYGYLMGQYFHMKYLVVYGLSTSVAKFENISVPSLPKCIGRIHLYSDMWKYFDNGLYKFLLRAEVIDLYSSVGSTF
ncbi:hypothetical protein WA026_013338 [Henosepilachna vigintioctopunctata]|uniref:Uncharacterized protein n=1 Tax=Henosepilachna vigintioctopunctata TaxID=420089 RepID=A0AAW1VEK4_9CUCU